MKTILIEMQVNDATVELTPVGVAFAIQQAFGPEAVGAVTAEWYPFGTGWIRHDCLDLYQEANVVLREGYLLDDSPKGPISDEQIIAVAKKVADDYANDDEYSSERTTAIRNAYEELFGNEEEA